MSKLKSTYTDRLPEQINPRTGRIHTSYHQAMTSTGRLSSSDPNLQNIPVRTAEGRRIRQAFVAPKGYKLLAADYSQIELRIMAHLSKDEGLMNAFRNNLDVHTATAAEVFKVELKEVTSDQRRGAKAINFGLIYGMGAQKLGKDIGVDTKTAKAYIEPTSPVIRVFAIHGSHPRPSGGSRLCRDLLRSPPVPARDQLQQATGTRRRRTHGDQRADARHRGGHHQERHGGGG